MSLFISVVEVLSDGYPKLWLFAFSKAWRIVTTITTILILYQKGRPVKSFLTFSQNGLAFWSSRFSDLISILVLKQDTTESGSSDSATAPAGPALSWWQSNKTYFSIVACIFWNRLFSWLQNYNCNIVLFDLSKIFASVVLLICDRESEEIFYKERPGNNLLLLFTSVNANLSSCCIAFEFF